MSTQDTEAAALAARYPTLTDVERSEIGFLDAQAADLDEQIEGLRKRRAKVAENRRGFMNHIASRAHGLAEIAATYRTTGSGRDRLVEHVEALYPALQSVGHFGVDGDPARWLVPELRFHARVASGSPQDALALASALRTFAAECAPDPIVLSAEQDAWWVDHFNGWHAASTVLVGEYFTKRSAYIYYTRPDADGALPVDQAVLVDVRHMNSATHEPGVIASGTLVEVLAETVRLNSLEWDNEKAEYV